MKKKNQFSVSCFVLNTTPRLILGGTIFVWKIFLFYELIEEPLRRWTCIHSGDLWGFLQIFTSYEKKKTWRKTRIVTNSARKTIKVSLTIYPKEKFLVPLSKVIFAKSCRKNHSISPNLILETKIKIPFHFRYFHIFLNFLYVFFPKLRKFPSFSFPRIFISIFIVFIFPVLHNIFAWKCALSRVFFVNVSWIFLYR